ncbi:MAG TPA: hypothetical protein VFF81_03095 [Noviherbaspirillum sp.]|nr:hypothetical protein [Noviherbaspirillum sp.]
MTREDLAHLRQGDMGGACGPYCLMMCLMLIGVVNRDEATSASQLDGRTAVGKLWTSFRDFPAFFTNGTSLEHLSELLTVFQRRVDSERTSGSGPSTRKFVHHHLKQNHPVILGINSEDFCHWIVAVGWEDADNDGLPERFLVLDPGNDPSRLACWNAVIDLGSRYGRYPYPYWNDRACTYVALDGAMALW